MFGSTLRTGKGSITADASLSLPVFILCLSLLFSLIYQAAEEDSLYRKLCAEANTVSTVLGTIDADLPFMVTAGQTVSRKTAKAVFYRPFCGESSDVRRKDITVYIFPKSGIRYHVAGCSTMEHNSAYIPVSKTEAVAGGYTECRLCGTGGYDYFKKYGRRPFFPEEE